LRCSSWFISKHSPCVCGTHEPKAITQGCNSPIEEFADDPGYKRDNGKSDCKHCRISSDPIGALFAIKVVADEDNPKIDEAS
jgi:hypothetical protein